MGVGSKTTEIGSTTLRLADMEDVTIKHTCEMIPTANSAYRGSILLHCTVEDLRILPLAEYSFLWKLLTNPTPASIELLSKPFTGEMDEFTRALFGVFHGSGGLQVVTKTLNSLLLHEISHTGEKRNNAIGFYCLFL